MRHFNHLFIFFAVLLFASCKKDEFQTTQTAALKVVNAIVGGTTARLGSVTTNISNNGNANFDLHTGNPDIYVWPVGDSLNPYYNANKSVSVAEKDIFTLFLAGVPGAVESLLVKEDLSTRTDSTMGVRFINLSPNSPAVNVTLATSTTINEFENIGYKGITEFKTYPADKVNSAYTFEVRFVNDPNVVIASLTMSGTNVPTYVPVFKNVTLVLVGLVGGAPALGLTRVNYY